MSVWSVAGRGAACWLVWALSLVSAGCQGAATPEPPPPAPPKPSKSAPKSCPDRGAAPRHDAPENVYAAYAEAINQGRWCDAIAVFDAKSKPRAAVVNFRNLALLAGGTSPKQREYAVALKQFCMRHELDCALDGWLPSYLALLAKVGSAPGQQLLDPPPPQLVMVTRHAEAAPDGTYLELMEALQAVQPDGMARLDPKLFSIEHLGDTATGMAQRVGSLPFQLTFRRTAEGWKLTMGK